MISAVSLQNQDQDSVVLQHQIPHFQSPLSNLLAMASLRYGAQQSHFSGPRTAVGLPAYVCLSVSVRTINSEVTCDH